MNKKVVYGGIAIIIVLLVAILATILGKESSASSIAPESKPVVSGNPTTFEKFLGKEAPVPNPDVMTTLIEVPDPFGGPDSQGVTFGTTNTETFSPMVAMMEQPVNGPMNHTLDSDFGSTLMGESDLTSDGEFKIIHRFIINEDSVLAWDAAPESSDFKWNTQPNRVALSFGSVADVVYTTKDASGQWTGDVVITQPN